MSAGELILTDALQVCDMSLRHNQSRRMTNSGASAVVVYGPARWFLRAETEFLDMAQARNWSAWLARRKGGAVTFTAWRIMRGYPAGAIGADEGVAVLSSINTGASTIAIGSAGAYQARKGDMVSFRTAANGYWLGEVTGDVNASGGAATLAVEPRPRTQHASTPALRRVKALAEFELTTDLDPWEDYTSRRLSFEAMQVIR